MSVENAVKLRATLKKRKPTFTRGQTNQYAKLRNKDGWRAPKGMGHKMRRRWKGQKKMPAVGYGSPSLAKGLNSKGLLEVTVFSVEDLSKIQKGQIAQIGATVGGRKRLAILTEAKKKNMKIANVKNMDEAIKKLTKVKKEEKKAEATPVKEEAKAETPKKEAKTGGKNK